MPMSQEKKNCRIIFRVTANEKEAFQTKVKEANTTESELLRERVLNDQYYIVAREPKASLDKKHLRMLYNKASNNLNQIAHQLNSYNLQGMVTRQLFETISLSLTHIRNDLKKGLEHVD
ncbi:mobilization protein [Vibrio ichthyoenteri ATCC 700023]|uniref:Mobilization protein n=1 Tax=Vibrio ichthyoenteri ATCC 700023 TaxID=870968 RepID=F9S7S3_9VIBR|nr:plasmid mobilization relaxosome protein MobC [Vibrio ichthyoenteri]EGU30973.1 mobilization protein [Vibrio ichthyoenteri ATCC 700023]